MPMTVMDSNTQTAHATAGNFQQFREYLLGQRKPTKLHMADLLIDDPILKQYSEQVLGRIWIDREDDQRRYFENYAACYIHMGFDYIPVHFWIQNSIKNFPTPETWIAADKGLVSTREEYQNFPWEGLDIDYSALDILTEFLPDTMKLVVVTGDLQDLMDIIVGTVSFFMLMYDDPELLDAIIERWYSLKYGLYTRALQYESVGALFTCADLGSKSATLFSPDIIREKLMPWYRKFSGLAHSKDRMYWFHSCGNLYTHNVIEMLTSDVNIDAFHSFQDEILPVSQFLSQYGEQTAALGGIDLDKLCSLPNDELVTYIDTTVRQSLKNGRYALGTGNSVPEYVPFEKFLVMVEYAKNFRVS